DRIGVLCAVFTNMGDAILTRDMRNAQRFVNEVAVSTQKLHARGPMGLEALTTYKWIGIGDYTIRA
ncbi:hypothetical protein ACUODJ_33490, partial [Escherichia sp. HC-CC]